MSKLQHSDKMLSIAEGQIGKKQHNIFFHCILDKMCRTFLPNFIKFKQTVQEFWWNKQTN